MQRGPDKAAHLPGDGGGGNVNVLSASDKMIEAFAETMLGLHGDGDDLGRLSLPATREDQVGAAAMSIVPGRFDKKTANVRVACFGDRTTTLHFTRRAFAGH